MTISAPSCTNCHGVFVCAGCERSLRKQLAETPEATLHAGDDSGVQHFFDKLSAERLYTTRFETGPRGGAMIPIGNAITLECFLPYEEPEGLSLPFMPMELTGEIIHDIGKKKVVDPWEVEACQTGRCECSDRPNGWIITRPIARALLGVTDSWINDRGREVPGLLSHLWALTYAARPFMSEAYFGEILMPTRAESRAARNARERARAAEAWRHTQLEHSRRGKKNQT